MILQDLKCHFHFRYIPMKRLKICKRGIHQGFDVTAAGMAWLCARYRAQARSLVFDNCLLLIVGLPTQVQVTDLRPRRAALSSEYLGTFVGLEGCRSQGITKASRFTQTAQLMHQSSVLMVSIAKARRIQYRVIFRSSRRERVLLV